MTNNFTRLCNELGLFDASDHRGVCLGLAQEFAHYYLRGSEAFRGWLKMHRFIRSLGRSGNIDVNSLCIIIKEIQNLQKAERMNIESIEDQRKILAHLSCVEGLSESLSHIDREAMDSLQLIYNCCQAEAFIQGVYLAQRGHQKEYEGLFADNYSTHQGHAAKNLWNEGQKLLRLGSQVRVDKEKSFNKMLKDIRSIIGNSPVVFYCFFGSMFGPFVDDVSMFLHHVPETIF